MAKIARNVDSNPGRQNSGCNQKCNRSANCATCPALLLSSCKGTVHVGQMIETVAGKVFDDDDDDDDDDSHNH